MERRGDGVPIIQRETLGLSGKPAEFRLVANRDLLVVLPSAPVAPSPARVRITVYARGSPLPDADVLALYPNHTWRRATSDGDGVAEVSLYTTELPITVFAAARGYGAHLERGWIPSRGSLAIELEPLVGGGAVIFPEETGHVPGLVGRLNPVRDTLDRTCLYASNIAINKGRPQPVPFTPGEAMRLSDAEGREMHVRIVEVAGRSALVEYRPLTRRDGR